MTLLRQKEELRRHARTLPPMEAGALLRRFAELPQVQCADTVLLYYGVGSEPDTRPLIAALTGRGQRVALPVCLPGRRMEARLYCGEEHLLPNRYGIPEPDSACPAIPQEEIGAVLVPCVLCDREGYRLGHGGGYYDRWLAGYSGFTAIVCPRTHLVEHLPREPHDLPVRLVLTEE